MGAGPAAALAAGMRAAADLIEESGAAGLYVSCDDIAAGEIRIQVSGRAGDAPARARAVAALAGLLAGSPCQYDSRSPASAWLQADGQAGGIAIHVCTELGVATTVTAGGAAAPLAVAADGYRAVVPAGHRLPPGWRWVTELDESCIPSGQEVP